MDDAFRTLIDEPACKQAAFLFWKSIGETLDRIQIAAPITS
jgi:hypothetical protein